MAEHMKEPWYLTTAEADEDYFSSEKGIVGNADTHADARRIIACVNALAGLETEVLEIFNAMPSRCVALSALIGALRHLRDNAKIDEDCLGALRFEDSKP